MGDSNLERGEHNIILAKLGWIRRTRAAVEFENAQVARVALVNFLLPLANQAWRH